MSDQGSLHQRSTDYGKLPAKLMHDQTVTDGAKILYAHMHWRYGNNHQNFESLSSMGKALGVSDQTIANRVHELEAANWVVTIERRSAEKGNFISNFYHVFEVQGSAKKFRSSYKSSDGETIREAPLARVKKSRKGKGGNPSNLKKSDTTPIQVGSTVPTQVGQLTTPTQVGTASPTQVGTIQSHIIQSQEEAPATETSPLDQKAQAELMVRTWLKTAGRYSPLAYDHAKAVELALPLVDEYTLEDVRLCTATQCKNRPMTNLYHFSYLVKDLVGFKARRIAQAPTTAKKLDDFSQYRLDMMRQEEAEKGQAAS